MGNTSRLGSLSMRRDPLSLIVAEQYGRLPWKKMLLRSILRREGGQLTSVSLRVILRKFYDVEVGPFSYGSLLEPGRSDRGLTIGSYVSIGPNVLRFGAAHPVERLSMHPYWYNPALGVVDKTNDVVRTSCVIESEAWIGANVTILPGCRRIGVGAVVGAGSVVTKDVPDFAVCMGNPARVRKQRLTPELRATLLDGRHWLLEPASAHTHLSKIAAANRNTLHVTI